MRRVCFKKCVNVIHGVKVKWSNNLQQSARYILGGILTMPKKPRYGQKYGVGVKQNGTHKMYHWSVTLE
jgi:hypothetical protein